jgi:hypothetical protein
MSLTGHGGSGGALLKRAEDIGFEGVRVVMVMEVLCFLGRFCFAHLLRFELQCDAAFEVQVPATRR